MCMFTEKRRLATLSTPSGSLSVPRRHTIGPNPKRLLFLTPCLARFALYTPAANTLLKMTQIYASKIEARRGRYPAQSIPKTPH